ncbi:hypothetical protein [Paenibacillus silvisoli]|uniref:hypothetical protein n=1 Tax=Paenibacillus silvisoli TaxID=3110539 RepID=UPI0028064DE2|nr:hypothetical protein [Paenibacillus silvisoli]
MKEKMIEFLLKRLGSKVDELRVGDYEGLHEHVIDDIQVYMEELKSLLSDILL